MSDTVTTEYAGTSDNEFAARSGIPEGALHLPRVLFIQAGPAEPPVNSATNMFHHLSSVCSGDLLSVWWEQDSQVARSRRKEIVEASGGIGFHYSLTSSWPFLARMIWQFLFYVIKGLQLSIFGGRYDVIFAYGPFKTGLAGWIIATLTGARLIIDMPVNPNRTWTKADTDKLSLEARVKRTLANAFVPFLLKRASLVKLLYPGQLDAQDLPPTDRVRVFHDFVALDALSQVPIGAEGNYILSLGYPYHRKGVDVLIRAFNEISPRFPQVELRIVGHCEDRRPFEALTEGNPRISFSAGVAPDEAKRLIRDSMVFVLASRTEGLARVLLEAMAGAKPIVASAVDGTPHCIRHEQTGLLFPNEDHHALAEELTRVLGSADYRRALGSRAREIAISEFSESEYVRQFSEMCCSVMQNSAAARVPNWRNAT